MFLHTGLTEHCIFSVTRSTIFFNSTVFVISILVFFLIRRQSPKLTLKTKRYHSCGCCDDPQSCEQLKKHATDKYFEKKVNLEPQSPSVTGKVCYHYNSWVTGIYVWQKFCRKNISDWVIIESNLRSFGYFKYSTVLWLLLDPSCKGHLLTRVG